MVREKLVVAVDLDGVCAEFMEGFMQRIRRRPSTLAEYALEAMYPDTPLSYLIQIVNDPVLYQGLLPAPGAAWTLSYVANYADLSLVYYTARPKAAEIGTFIWLRDHAFPNHNQVKLFGTHAEKLDGLLDDRPWALLDDSLDMINNTEGAIPHRYIFDRPWNQGLAHGATRVLGWNDFSYTLAMNMVAEFAGA